MSVLTMQSAIVAHKPAVGAMLTTCEAAAELCKKTGTRVLWRPGGTVNWMLPELDAAEVTEG